MKIIKYFFEFIIVITLFIFFKLIGKKNASDIGCNLARLLGSLFRSTKKIEDNLNLAFPKLNQSQQKKIINDMWCNFGRTFAEYVFLNEFQKKNQYC
jgi:KDO2-lipid IV(A) lauroyltransferase